MATKPQKDITKTHDELRQQFHDEGWETKLQFHADAGRMSKESEPGRGNTLKKTRYKYWDEEHNVVCVLFRYRRIDGDRLVVRMLRDGDTVYSGPAVAATPSDTSQ